MVLSFLSSPRHYIQDTVEVPFSARYVCLALFIVPRARFSVSVIPISEINGKIGDRSGRAATVQECSSKSTDGRQSLQVWTHSMRIGASSQSNNISPRLSVNSPSKLDVCVTLHLSPFCNKIDLGAIRHSTFFAVTWSVGHLQLGDWSSQVTDTVLAPAKPQPTKPQTTNYYFKLRANA